MRDGAPFFPRLSARLAGVAALLLAGAMPADAAEAPLNYFLHSHGPASAPTQRLGWIFAAVMVAVCLVVAGLMAYAMLRRRAAVSPGGLDAVGDNGKALRWIAIGTGISTAILFALAGYSLVVLNQVGSPSQPPGLTLTVTGYDWWWRIDYNDGAAGEHFTTANEIHIPVGVPVRLLLNSADVIHAFWVPQLAGKTQMIPGLTNEQWLQADSPGVYRGQCAQYCGVQHAHMAMEVVAQSMSDYTKWLEAQRAEAGAAGAPSVEAGRTLFLQRCAGCHTVRGIAADGAHGPDLTHLGSRRLIAAGLMANTPKQLMDWILHAQAYKPGSRMPNMLLTPGESAELSDFLATLN